MIFVVGVACKYAAYFVRDHIECFALTISEVVFPSIIFELHNVF